MLLAAECGLARSLAFIWDPIPCSPVGTWPDKIQRGRKVCFSLATHSDNKILYGDLLQAKGHTNSLLTEAIRGVGAMKALQTSLHRGCRRIHGILSGQRIQAGRDGARRRTGSSSERGSACALRGGIGQTCSSASSCASLGDFSGFWTFDGPCRNRQRFRRAKIGVAGRSEYCPAAAGSAR